jgi:SAM-dependent methyltransferase
VVDLGCGPGFYTEALRSRGASVIPVDSDPGELALAGAPPGGALIADAGDLPLEDASVDGAFCSNMLEHTPTPERVVAEIERVLRPGGWGYISWTNWYSPWGGHDISPYHYLGPRVGPRLYRRLKGRPRKNVPGEGLFPCHIGPTLRMMRSRPGLEIERVEPRYWPRLSAVCRVPLLRELVTWNCVVRVRRT